MDKIKTLLKSDLEHIGLDDREEKALKKWIDGTLDFEKDREIITREMVRKEATSDGPVSQDDYWACLAYQFAKRSLIERLGRSIKRKLEYFYDMDDYEDPDEFLTFKEMCTFFRDFTRTYTVC